MAKQGQQLSYNASALALMVGFLAAIFFADPVNAERPTYIFWTDKGNSKIQRVGLNGGGITDLTTGIAQQFDIAVDGASGKMYWTVGNPQKIQRANVDGTGVEDVVTGLGAITFIALDVANNHIYWSSESDPGKISRRPPSAWR